MIQEDDKLMNTIKSSTRGLLASFRTKAELLSQCSEDVKQFLREGYDVKIAKVACQKLFGEDKTTISFLAIDGTQSQDQELDMLIFYAGTYGYTGQLDVCCVDLYLSLSECLNSHEIMRVILHPDTISRKLSRRDQLELLTISLSEISDRIYGIDAVCIEPRGGDRQGKVLRTEIEDIRIMEHFFDALGLKKAGLCIPCSVVCSSRKYGRDRS